MTPTTGDAHEPCSVRAAGTFLSGVPQYDLGIAGNSQVDAEARTCLPTEVGQPMNDVPQPGPSTGRDQQASSSAALGPTVQPEVSLTKPGLKILAEAMFASDAGKPVDVAGDFGDVEPTNSVVLVAGEAIDDLVTAYADRRHMLARPGGALDKVEMLGYLLGRVFCGRLVAWEEAEPLGKAAGKMVFGKRTVATLYVALAEAKKQAGRRAGRLPAEDV